MYCSRAECTSEGTAWGSTYSMHEGGTIPIPCTVKTMRQLTCTDRMYKANHQIRFGARMSILQSSLWSVEYVACGGAFERPCIYRTSTYVHIVSMMQDILEFKPRYRPMVFELRVYPHDQCGDQDRPYCSPELLVAQNTLVSEVVELLCNTVWVSSLCFLFQPAIILTLLVLPSSPLLSSPPPLLCPLSYSLSPSTDEQLSRVWPSFLWTLSPWW